MTIESFSPGLNHGGRKDSEFQDEKTAPLLPKVHDGEDREGHDYVGASLAGSVFNLSTSIIGAGIMALPATMKVLGLVPGIIMIIFVGLLTEASLEMLIRFSRAAKKNSFFGVMKDAYRKIGRRVVQISVVVNNAGIMTVYMIIIGDVLSGTSAGGEHHSGVLEEWFGARQWNSRGVVLLVTTLFVFAPLTSFKRVDSLRVSSAVSVALAVVFVVITAGIGILRLVEGSIQMPRLFPQLTDWASIWNIFTAVPVLITAFVCHYNIHSIDNELHHSSQIHLVVRISILLCSTIYILTSFFAFLLFGDSTLGDVLANFDSSYDLGIPYGSAIKDVVRVSYALHIMLVFPVVFFALRLNFDGLLFPKASPLDSNPRRFVSVTVILLAVIYLTANFVPSIWDVFQITGATATVLIGFIFPACIALRDSNEIATRRDKILSVVMIVLAVVSSSVAIYSDVSSISRSKKTST